MGVCAVPRGVYCTSLGLLEWLDHRSHGGSDSDGKGVHCNTGLTHLSVKVQQCEGLF